MEYLTLEEVYLLHERLIQLTGAAAGCAIPVCWSPRSRAHRLPSTVRNPTQIYGPKPLH